MGEPQHGSVVAWASGGMVATGAGVLRECVRIHAALKYGPVPQSRDMGTCMDVCVIFVPFRWRAEVSLPSGARSLAQLLSGLLASRRPAGSP